MFKFELVKPFEHVFLILLNYSLSPVRKQLTGLR
jgi:hypothetical protein